MNNKTFNLIRTVGEIAVPVIACIKINPENHIAFRLWDEWAIS